MKIYKNSIFFNLFAEISENDELILVYLFFV